MDGVFRNLALLLFPILIMVVTNEVIRPTIKDKPYSIQGITAINSAGYYPDKCSWACHNNTGYCKTNHVKYLKPYYGYTDVFYFGVISALQATGNYGAANILLLVLLFPLTIWLFVVKSLNIQDKINRIKNKNK